MRRIPLALVTLAAFALPGCMSFSGHFGTPIRVQNLPRIVDGETTRAEITEWFGPPSAFFNPTFLELIFVDDENPASAWPAPVLNDVFTYRHIENQTRVLFFPMLFARVHSEAESETLIVFFDERGVVEYHAYRRDRAGPGEAP